jgi:hypothetical protein
MPLSHRIACFRDDIIFFGYLYQRWKYPVDKTRPNEFGRAYDDAEPEKAALEAKALPAGKGDEGDAAAVAEREETTEGAGDKGASAGADADAAASGAAAAAAAAAATAAVSS